MYNLSLHFHFVGIGGSGTSGLAEILLASDFQVSGSDIKESPVTDRLRTLGAHVFIGHQPSHIPLTASLVVFSAAVSTSNPEIIEAKRRGLPVVPRAEVLAELMRLRFGIAIAGSHGKTTTTSFISAILDKAGLDPTTVVGGIVKGVGGGGKHGDGKFLVAEACESDRSFLLLRPAIAVVTNIDEEHMTAYASVADLENSFGQFISSVPFYGLAVLCVDDLRLRKIKETISRRTVTFGLSPDADITARNLTPDRGKMHYDVLVRGEFLFRATLPMPGAHMVSNSLGAIAVALELGIDVTLIADALSQFSGVGRRMEIISQKNEVTIINDYGHHPTEIRATLRAIRDGWAGTVGTMHVIFQPHRYSRTRDSFVEFLTAFADADRLIITEIYSAGEEPILNITGTGLTDAISHPDKKFVASLSEIIPLLQTRVKPHDVVVILGAGTIGTLAVEIADWQNGVAH